MHKITETFSESLPKRSVQLSIYNHVGLSSFSRFPSQPCLNHPCKNVKYVCMFKKSSSLFCLDSFSMLVLAERLGSSQPLNTQIDFPTVSNGEERSKNTDCFGSVLTFICVHPIGMNLHMGFNIEECESLTRQLMH